MTPAQTIIAKELRSFFVSPVVYVIGAIFLAVVGLLSYQAVANTSNQALRLMQLQNTYAQLNLNETIFRPLFQSMNFILMIILPLLTMRLFAEERKLRTFELLLTSPIGVNEIVSGKFLSVVIIYAGLLSLTGLIPLTLSAYATFDWSPHFPRLPRTPPPGCTHVVHWPICLSSDREPNHCSVLEFWSHLRALGARSIKLRFRGFHTG